MRFDILTLFPEMFASYLGESILRKALERELIHIELHNIRDWTHDKHHRVDDRPFGGGPGMVMMAPPVVACVEAVQQQGASPGRLILLTPQGKRLNQQLAEQYAKDERLVLLCGRYEGFDQRVIDILQPEEVSLGDFVLNGGEVAAMALVEAVIRLLPNVLGDEASSQQDSFSGTERMLEGPQYTRPREFRGHAVPEVLLSGNHEEIARWRHEQSLQKTKERRADLLDET